MPCVGSGLKPDLSFHFFHQDGPDLIWMQSLSKKVYTWEGAGGGVSDVDMALPCEQSFATREHHNLLLFSGLYRLLRGYRGVRWGVWLSVQDAEGNGMQSRCCGSIGRAGGWNWPSGGWSRFWRYEYDPLCERGSHGNQIYVYNRFVLSAWCHTQVHRTLRIFSESASETLRIFSSGVRVVIEVKSVSIYP